MKPLVKIKRLPHGEGLALPAYETSGAAGMDLRAALDEAEPLELEPGKRALVPTGIAVELPVDHEGLVRPRSGLAINHGVTVLNAPGTIDSDYRGEIKVALINLGEYAVEIARGTRIAQMVVTAVHQAVLEEVDVLSDSDRGERGFGSTGTD